jgi:uncharacterized membrane protein
MSTERTLSAPATAACATPVAPVAALATAHARLRLASIDVLRGFVIALMALDHVRDYFGNAHFDALDLSQTTGPLFLTRWVTHFCAPTFIFLAGISARLAAQRMTPAQLSRFLFTRGVWMVVLEITVVNFAWTFNLHYQTGFFLQVIWAIGVSMIVLAALVHLPMRALAVFSIVVIFGHNLLDGITPDRFGAWAPLWSVLHVRGPIPVGFLSYPLIPWFAVMAFGYVAGSVFLVDAQQRRRRLLQAGFGALALFVVLRFTNVYGDAIPWSVQDTWFRTVLSFVNVSKYPPSLLYLLVTLGTASLLLAAFESARGRCAEILRTFGRVPLFVYVLHIVLAHLVAGVIAIAMGFGPSVLTNPFPLLPKTWGFDLPLVYVAWLAVLAALYPACKWYAAVKRRRTDWWLSYL